MQKRGPDLPIKSHVSSKASRHADSNHPERPGRNLQSLKRGVSPPPALKRRRSSGNTVVSAFPQSHSTQSIKAKSAAAAIEAGESTIQDPIAFYSTHLLPAIRSPDLQSPRISHADWLSLYHNNAGSKYGCHFVVHQHDHPIAGTHYDLRLQCNETSSISFAIMYGLPGNPNSRRLNRNATETRVHCLGNHLIETASYTTGSMLIWDTGSYEVLPYLGDKEDSADHSAPSADDSGNDDSQDRRGFKLTEQMKLKQAFQRRKIKLRLHGTRLPKGYTLSLRLTKVNDRSEQPQKPSKRRRRKEPGTQQSYNSDTSSDREISDLALPQSKKNLSSLSGLASQPSSPHLTNEVSGDITTVEDTAVAVSDEENEVIRVNNAYPGATNDIGSVHQRTWYLSVDRAASGFVKHNQRSASGFVGMTWHRRNEESLLANGLIGHPTGFEQFVVGGRETERSVVTGRLASEVLADEGVIGYTPRGLWRAITE